MYIYIRYIIRICISDSPFVDHFVMKEFVSGPPFKQKPEGSRGDRSPVVEQSSGP